MLVSICCSRYLCEYTNLMMTLLLASRQLLMNNDVTTMPSIHQQQHYDQHQTDEVGHHQMGGSRVLYEYEYAYVITSRPTMPAARQIGIGIGRPPQERMFRC